MLKGDAHRRYRYSPPHQGGGTVKQDIKDQVWKLSIFIIKSSK